MTGPRERRGPGRILAIFLVAALVSLFSGAVVVVAGRMPCVGDVDGNGAVTIDELIAGVNAALGNDSIDATAFDRDESGSVEIAELVAAVRSALAGCVPGTTVTETPSPSGTATPLSTLPPATASAVASPSPQELAGSFERSTAFDTAAAGIELPDGVNITSSAMCVDLDGDGLLDVLVVVGEFSGTRSTWVLFQRAPDVWDPAVELRDTIGPRALTDLNGDGYLDLLLADTLRVAWGGPKGIDLSGAQNVPGVTLDAAPSAITPMDFDGDGRTDVALSTFGGRDRVLYQEEDGSFVERQLGLGQTFALCPVDFDADGLPDLLSMVDGLFEADVNEGGAWRQTAPRSWLRQPPESWPADRYLAPGSSDKGTPMGCAWGDLDGDPDLELWLSQFSLMTPIYDLQGNSWRDVGGTLPGVADNPRNDIQGLEIFWGVAIVDFDGDGRDDIAVAGGNDVGHIGSLGRDGASHVALFIQQAAGFRERGRELGLDETGDFVSVIADDLDRDGRPDLLVGAFRSLPRLYLNRLDRRGGMLVLEPRGAAVENVEIEVIGRSARWTTRPGLQAQPLVGARPVVFRGVGGESELLLRVHWPTGVQELTVFPRPEPWVIEFATTTVR